MLVLKILLILVCIFIVLFLVSLVIYFFNLDMKLAAKLTPFMNWHYNRIKRKRLL